ncbi:uncharacterized protein LOC134267941 isoform X2 [Saccostrea cucullata]|uniref:uncharacterized protein LOC134267941 isoform X2 n=1 Tax=Saccostrea cuccullata TaxID=36930 RepID=UPI002ED0860E
MPWYKDYFILIISSCFAIPCILLVHLERKCATLHNIVLQHESLLKASSLKQDSWKDQYLDEFRQDLKKLKLELELQRKETDECLKDRKKYEAEFLKVSRIWEENQIHFKPNQDDIKKTPMEQTNQEDPDTQKKQKEIAEAVVHVTVLISIAFLFVLYQIKRSFNWA